MYAIKPSVLEDAPDIEKLVNGAYRGESGKQGWTTEADLLSGTRIDAEILRGIIQQPGTVILKYLRDDELLGCVELRLNDDRMYLGMLTVKPNLQGGGIGKTLLSVAEAEAKKQNCKRIFMKVISIRSELIAWYVRHGYHDTGKREPFNFSDPRFGTPTKQFEFMELEKVL